jgi:hypothetical protein
VKSAEKWPCPKGLPGGSQDAQLYDEGGFAELLLRAR